MDHTHSVGEGSMDMLAELNAVVDGIRSHVEHVPTIISESIARNRANKDTTPHFIPQNVALPVTDDVLVVTHKTMAEMTAAVDAAELNEDDFIRRITLECETKANALRHRAHMMRIRAGEFDELADLELKQCQSTVVQIIQTRQKINDIEALLREYAHIEPKRVRVKE